MNAASRAVVTPRSPGHGVGAERGDAPLRVFLRTETGSAAILVAMTDTASASPAIGTVTAMFVSGTGYLGDVGR
jgi:hypothetical protein